jgi:hypothetical protein
MKTYLKITSSVLLCLASVPALSATTAQFFGMQGMINVAAPSLGPKDSDAQNMMGAMNVPVQQSMLGPGKAITAEGQILNYICANRGSNGDYTCSIIIQNSPHSKLSPTFMSYQVQGELASALHEKFYPNQADGSYQFTSVDGTLQVRSTNDEFEVTYQK